MVRYHVSSFERRKPGSSKRSVHVRGHFVNAKGSGRSRGRKHGIFSGEKPWITRKGKLGGPGFLSKTRGSRERLLDSCVKSYGYRSCLGSVNVLSRNRKVKAKYGAEIREMMNYLEDKYGRRK